VLIRVYQLANITLQKNLIIIVMQILTIESNHKKLKQVRYYHKPQWEILETHLTSTINIINHQSRLFNQETQNCKCTKVSQD